MVSEINLIKREINIVAVQTGTRADSSDLLFHAVFFLYLVRSPIIEPLKYSRLDLRLLLIKVNKIYRSVQSYIFLKLTVLSFPIYYMSYLLSSLLVLFIF